MILERFYPQRLRELYARFSEKGRMLPEGVRYLDSWIDEEVTICYQVMEADSVELLQTWIDRWKDLADFEVVPVISSAEAKEKVMSSRIDGVNRNDL